MQLSGFLACVASSISLALAILQAMSGLVAATVQEPVPYLLFTTQSSIFRLYLNGSTDAELISTPAEFQIQKIGYNLRQDQMFWIDSSAKIMTSRLDGSEQRLLISTGDEPADLAVDWLNDKLYWVHTQLRQIEEYDLSTGTRRVVASTGELGESTPVTLALYPYPNYGWLYWSDSTSNSIEMVSVRGDDRSTFHTNVACANTLSIDYNSHTLYWINHCSLEVEGLRLDGDTSTHAFPLDHQIFFPGGLTVFNGIFYLAEDRGVISANVSREDEADIRILYHTTGTRATGIQVVHPSQQPPAKVYETIVTDVNFTFQCNGECVHGNCIPPGLCACDSGWQGDLCDTDIEECSESNGGCQQLCTELEGGFQCSCHDGFVLTYDNRTCSVGCNATIVTVTGAPLPSETFDPCLLYVPETRTTVALTTSLMSSSPVVLRSTAVVKSPSISTTTVASSSISGEEGPVETSSVRIMIVETSSQLISPSVEPTTTDIGTTSIFVSSSSTPPVQPPPSSPPSPVSPEQTTFTEVEPSVVSVEITKEKDDGIIFGLSLYDVIGIAVGIALLVISSIIVILVIVILAVRRKRHKNRSWSPQKSVKSNGNGEIHGIDSTSVKPVNGTLSKVEEADLELDDKASQNVYVDQA